MLFPVLCFGVYCHHQKVLPKIYVVLKPNEANICVKITQHSYCCF